MAKPDIGGVFDEHVAAEFVHLDLEATMATMTDAHTSTTCP